MIKSLLSLAGGSPLIKVLLPIIAVLIALCVSAFVGMQHYQRNYDEILKNKADIEANFNRTKVLLERQNQFIQDANAKLNTYEKDIQQIKRAANKEFASIKQASIDDCNDFAENTAKLLKVYEKTSVLKSAEVTEAQGE